ncbi:MAG: M20/M25/M40 family metallo-hydrolase [Elusimicrobiota bacterium]
MLDAALKYCARRRERFVADLAKLVAVPGVSAAGFPRRELERSGNAVAGLLRGAGLEHVRLLRIPGAPPYVYGDWLHAPGKPTVLLYAHHDVQPPGRRGRWKSPPFQAARRGGRLYGRGAADDKAGVVMHAASIAAYLRTSGRLPVNVKVLIEGEEETGSEHLASFLRKYTRLVRADVVVIADTDNYDTGVPSITTSLRGLVANEVTVESGRKPLHSGMWGGGFPDPVIALGRIIASLTDRQGRIAIPGIRSGSRPMTALERRHVDSLRYGDADYRRQTGMLPGVKVVGGRSSALVKMWREPSVSVNAIQAGSREALSNIINEKAWCHVGIRIVPGMDPVRTGRLLRRHLKRNAPWGVKVAFGPLTIAPAWSVDPEDPAFAAARRALAKGYRREAVFKGCGGSIGFVGPLGRALGGAPALLIGVEDPYSNAHSENESLHLGDFEKSVRSAVHLYDELARS